VGLRYRQSPQTAVGVSSRRLAAQCTLVADRFSSQGNVDYGETRDGSIGDATTTSALLRPLFVAFSDPIFVWTKMSRSSICRYSTHDG
jgi:hypothetical protein